MQKLADDTTIIMIRVDRETKEQFAELVGSKRMSEMIRRMIAAYIKNNVSDVLTKKSEIRKRRKCA